MNRRHLILGAVALAACNGPRRIHEAPVLVNGDRVAGSGATTLARAAEADAERRRLSESRDSLSAIAAASCAPLVCAALSRGELAIGMTEAQVLAATRTTPAAWSTRRAAAATVMVAASVEHRPHDALGEIAMVQLAGAGVTSYSYREPQGIRVVSTSDDATTAGRARSRAGALMEEGDALAAAGDRAAALDRYDRALVLLPDDAQLQYRVATLLDQQLRPLEALMRYQTFLHLMEIERIDAYGNAYAKLADAIARARERVIVLEKQTR